MVSSGYVNPTPYNSYREIPDSTLFLKLDSMMRQVKEGDIILNAHAPPIDTKLDMAIGKDRKRYHVGYKAVRDIIETYKPIVSMGTFMNLKGQVRKY